MEHVVTAALTGLAVVLAVGWYLSYLATRLDRLHHRVESSWAALEAQLARRAGASLELAAALPAGAGAPLAAAAAAALRVADDLDREQVEQVELVENRLTRCLHETFPQTPQTGDPPVVATDAGAQRLIGELGAAAGRVQLARRFHNDSVAHAQRMRRKRVVRWARLAGRAAWPVMVELDDTVPEVLAAGAREARSSGPA